MHNKLITISIFALIVGTACANIPVPGRPPGRVIIELGSQVEQKSYSPEELSNPTRQSLIDQCKRQGGSNCGKKTTLANVLTNFVRAQDEKVVVYVQLGDLEAGRDYKVGCRWFDPEGNMLGRTTFDSHAPLGFQPDWHLDCWFFFTPFDPSKMQLGRWRVEITVNGQVEGERTFKVVDVE